MAKIHVDQVAEVNAHLTKAQECLTEVFGKDEKGFPRVSASVEFGKSPDEARINIGGWIELYPVAMLVKALGPQREVVGWRMDVVTYYHGNHDTPPDSDVDTVLIDRWNPVFLKAVLCLATLTVNEFSQWYAFDQSANKVEATITEKE